MGFFYILHIVEALNHILITKRDSRFRQFVRSKLAFSLLAEIIAIYQEQDLFCRGVIEQSIRRRTRSKCFSGSRRKND